MINLVGDDFDRLLFSVVKSWSVEVRGSCYCCDDSTWKEQAKRSWCKNISGETVIKLLRTVSDARAIATRARHKRQRASWPVRMQLLQRTAPVGCLENYLGRHRTML